MPVTVRELQINTTVSGSTSSGNNTNANNNGGGGGGGGLSKADKEIIIREAIRRVMEELEYKFGR